MGIFKRLFSGSKRVFLYVKIASIVVVTYILMTTMYLHFSGIQQIELEQPDMQKQKEELFLQTQAHIDNTDDPMLLTQYYMMKAITCIAVGMNCHETLEEELSSDAFNYSILGFGSNILTGMITNPPSSGVAWASQSLQDAGFIPKTYAAGIGFYSISGFSHLWELFRNLTYFLMALVIVALGFLIMFRANIDSQTVISVENSLPRIVLTLLFITFSYPIAGFLVDLMYISMMFIFQLLGSLNTDGLDANTLINKYLGIGFSPFQDLFQLKFVFTYQEGIFGLVDVLPDWLTAVISFFATTFLVVPYLYNQIIGPLLRAIGTIEIQGGIIALMGTMKVGEVIATLIGITLAGIIGIFVLIPLISFLFGVLIVLFLAFRIIFMLIGAYVQIILLTILAPIFILPNAIPGQNSFFGWFKKYFANVAVFPLTAALFVLSQIIVLNNNIVLRQNEVQFYFPMLNFDNQAMVAVLTAAFLLLIPNLVSSAKDAIAGEGGFDAGPGVLFADIGQATKAGLSQFGTLATFNQLANSQSPLGSVVRGIPFAKKIFGNRNKKPDTPDTREPAVDNLQDFYDGGGMTPA